MLPGSYYEFLFDRLIRMNLTPYISSHMALVVVLFLPTVCSLKCNNPSVISSMAKYLTDDNLQIHISSKCKEIGSK